MSNATLATPGNELEERRELLCHGTITLQVEDVVRALATIEAAAELLHELAYGGHYIRAVDDAFRQVAADLEKKLGITWQDDRHESDPIYGQATILRELQVADILEAIVADPDEALVPRLISRRDLADSATRCRARAASYGETGSVA